MTLEINEVSLTPFAEATIKTSRAARYIVSKLCMFEFGLSNSYFSFNPQDFKNKSAVERKRNPISTLAQVPYAQKRLQNLTLQTCPSGQT